ncbi:MAG: septum formation initiator family protein [Candidatus Moraniibacteriota bacterium]
MSWRSPWARLGFMLMFSLALFAGWTSFQQYERSVHIQQEIDVLKHEAERIARENETLSGKIQYFASPDFKEEEAKEKLGLRRQEEKVIAIEGDLRLEPDEPLADESLKTEAITWETPNYKKWWNVFFTQSIH